MEKAMPIAQEALRVLLFHPETAIHLWVAVGLSGFLFIIIYTKIGDWLDVPRSGLFSSLASGLLFAVLYAAITAAIVIFAGESLSKSIISKLPLYVGIGVSLLLVIPLICFLQKTNYQTALMNWVAGAAVFLLTAFVVRFTFDAIGYGKDTVKKEKARQEIFRDK